MDAKAHLFRLATGVDFTTQMIRNVKQSKLRYLTYLSKKISIAAD